jgi:hypothetical protein
MWICPKCSRENGNSFRSCKGCGYVLSDKEKADAIEETKQNIADFNYRKTAANSLYNGPKVEYDEDDEYFEDFYTDDMFDDDDYEKKSHKGVIIPIIIVLVLFAIGAGVIYYLNENGYINWFSSSDYVYTEDSSGITITGYNGKDTTLEIPDVIDGNVVTSIGKGAFEDSNLKSLTLPDTIKVIGERAFFNSKYLHVIDIADGVTEIGSYAFASCDGLADTYIPESVTTIGDNILKDSGNVYIKAVPGTTAMTYALSNDISYTPTDNEGTALTVTPVRSGDEQTLTTSNAGYGAGYMFSFTPYEEAKYKISVEASIEGYLKIDDFDIMTDGEFEETTNGKNHVTTVVANLKKEKKYYFAIVNEGSELNKNIQFSMKIETVTDEQTQAETKAKSWVGKVHSFSAYNDLFYEQHSESGTTHYLEWNTNKQKVIDYYIESDGTLWVAIDSPGSSDLYDENGEYIGDSSEMPESSTWWYKVED